MVKWARPTETTPEVSWISNTSPHRIWFSVTPNVERPWLVDLLITGDGESMQFSLHRDDARGLGYALEEHGWHDNLCWPDEEGIEEQ